MLILSTFLEKIQKIDLDLMILINRKWENPVFDALLPWLRESILWVPLYVFFISWSILNMGKKSIIWIFSGILTIVLSDQISSTLIKNTVARIRPCRDPEVLPYITLRLENCSGAYSFTSSHAANHFAFAIFIYLTLSPLIGKKYTSLMFFWAAAISYSQIYVGVHYPLDVVGGTLIGILSGWVTAKLYQTLSPKLLTG